MKHLLLGALLLCAACSAAPVGTSQNTTYSPREQMVTVMNGYGAVLAAADGAISSGKLPSDTVKKIAAGTHAATAAVDAATAEAKKCWRDQDTGVVGDAPGLPADTHCNPSASALLIGAAQSAIGSAGGILSAFNITVGAI